MTEQTGGYDRIVTDAPLDVEALRAWMEYRIKVLDLQGRIGSKAVSELTCREAAEGRRLLSQLSALPVSQPTPGPMAWKSVRDLVRWAEAAIEALDEPHEGIIRDVQAALTAVKADQAPEGARPSTEQMELAIGNLILSLYPALNAVISPEIKQVLGPLAKQVYDAGSRDTLAANGLAAPEGE